MRLIHLLQAFAVLAALGDDTISVHAGDNLWTTGGPYGGSVKTVAIHPLDHRILLLGTIQSGIYRSTDSGASWLHLNSPVVFPNQRVLRFHPWGPDTIYAATARGLLKSTDAGSTWESIAPPGHEQYEYRAFAINPEFPWILFAAGGVDAWKSTDAGQTWHDLNRTPSVGLEDFAIDPTDTRVMYFTSGSVPCGLESGKARTQEILGSPSKTTLIQRCVVAWTWKSTQPTRK